MPYLDEQGLDTLVKEIKDYALQKTSVEKQFEYTNSNSTTKYVCLESFKIPSDITDYMIVADITQTPFSNATRVGKLVLYHNTDDNATRAALYGDTIEGAVYTLIRYTSAIMDNTRYINIYVSTPAKASTLIHVHGINANFETTFAPSDYTIKDKWPSNVNAVNINTHVTIFADLRKSIDDLRDDVNTLQGLTGGSTSLGANHVVVTTDSKALTSVATLPISKGGTNATTAKAAQYNLLKDMNSDTTTVTDDLRVVAAHTKPNTTNGAVAYKKMSYFWTYIANKIRSTFGFSDSNVLPVKNGGTGVSMLGTMNSVLITGTDEKSVNSIQTSGGAFYADGNEEQPVFGTLPVIYGGTGGTTSISAKKNLGIHVMPIKNIYVGSNSWYANSSGLSSSCINSDGKNIVDITGVFPVVTRVSEAANETANEPLMHRYISVSSKKYAQDNSKIYFIVSNSCSKALSVDVQFLILGSY